MSRKMQIFHQLDEKIAETFLAHFHQDRLYVNGQCTHKIQILFLLFYVYLTSTTRPHNFNTTQLYVGVTPMIIISTSLKRLMLIFIFVNAM